MKHATMRVSAVGTGLEVISLLETKDVRVFGNSMAYGIRVDVRALDFPKSSRYRHW